ncbi:DNA gyrase inhibitor YacG [Methylobacter sp. S3L5C]|uniref:DNA gyrase inhibitor YacG n=1 Tax=Methylobacter sp. S3L5C TaxID=2839024 RepID=UPI001FAB593E|nr:DNA gyrase inhibitor YacG [Methylobacter sp. S3L5C]UOA08025.1 DNA gyrase inhibitor YacG [Methylobacter sp. S3L5C]
MSSTGKPITVKCPNCQRPVEWTPEQEFKPFCCERCKLIDLGEWAMEEKIIPGKSLELENDEGEDSFFQ